MTSMYRIVIIEDDPTMRQLLSKKLAGEGFECLMAPNGTAGLKTCREQKPDIVLLDVHLPDHNGIELCRTLKADPALRHIPVLIFTGESSGVDKKIEGLDAGADDYILKPFSPSELLARLKKLVRAGIKPTEN
ncbi:MAG: response regulator transcription factor [Elusimicrobia bacterium]|nr:response regulator transcription factor [Elusimicrobiota bacterium]